MAKILKLSLFCLIIFVCFTSNAQIKLKAILSSNEVYDFLKGQSTEPFRKILPLTENWNVFSESNPTKVTKVNIPCSFDGTESLVFEKQFEISKSDLHNYIIKIGFLGINHSVELSVNNFNIFKQNSGGIPFEVDLPYDILNENGKNKISARINCSLDSENTIPVKQRFLFPKNIGGIIREVYLVKIPKINIYTHAISYNIDSKLTTASVNIPITFNKPSANGFEGLINEGNILKVQFIPKNFSGATYSFELAVPKITTEQYNSTYKISLLNPVLWSIESPNIYSVEYSLFVNKQIIDKVISDIAFFKLENRDGDIYLNNNKFSLKGTTYYLNESDFKSTVPLNKIRNDLELIKKIGFNSVRFAKAYPNPIALKQTQELGLLALIELPINSVPEEILQSNDFKLHASNKLKELIHTYSKYSSTFLIGLGSSYLSNSNTTNNFLDDLIKNINKDNLLYYASFVGIQTQKVNGLDLYGVEIYSNSPQSIKEALLINENVTNEENYFFSEINYPTYTESSTGYLVKHSPDAQAKYYDSLIDIVNTFKLDGFFLNSIYNYSGDFASLFGKWSKNKNYQLGFYDQRPNLNLITFKLLNSKLKNGGKVTIPMGRAMDENKLMFILVALVLSILMALLINIKKKFREDCSRALFRPYNFFADIRDHRIISGFHTFILLLIETGSISLFFTILFYYLRSNLFVEKILISFGTPWLIDKFGYFAWNPEISFIYIWILILLKVLLLSLLIKFISFFIKTRIEFGSIFYVVVWSLLPFTLLLPVELILYKILATGSFSYLLLVFVILFWLWILQRLLKGIHVIFDVSKFSAYFYGLISIVLITIGILIYFQISNSSFYYIINAIKQYNRIMF